MAVREVGAARDVERVVAVRPDGVRVVAVVVARAVRDAAGVVVEVSEARGRGIERVLAVAGAEARGAAFTALFRPVSEVLGFEMVLDVGAVGVLVPGEVFATGVEVARMRPGVAGPRDGSDGMGCACTTAAAASDSLRRAGPDTGGRVLVNVLLRLLRMGVLTSLTKSLPSNCADEEEEQEMAEADVADKPLDALPERDRAGSAVTIVDTADARG